MTTTPTKTDGLYDPGDEIWIKAPEVKGTILKRLETKREDEGIGPKWLVRDENHQLKQVFSCEIESFRETQ